MSHAAGYVSGFLAATIALHAAGIGLGALRFGKAGQIAARFAGAVVAVSGVALLAG